MTPSDIDRLAASWRCGTWYEREAALAWRNRNAWIIPGRNDADVYLARFWLTPAIRRESTNGGEVIESGDSLLLHFFARGDDDQALHDHPWDFRTTILAGQYLEHLPPNDWQRTTVDGAAGPDWHRHTCWRNTGDTIGHIATDLHCVTEVMDGTWTLVRTGPRVREWGFHPYGQQWIGYREFLAAKRGQAATAEPAVTVSNA